MIEPNPIESNLCDCSKALRRAGQATKMEPLSWSRTMPEADWRRRAWE